MERLQQNEPASHRKRAIFMDRRENAAGQEAPVATGAYLYQISTPRVRALSITGSPAGQSTPDKVNRGIGGAGSFTLGQF